jgi:hypothetical protein
MQSTLELDRDPASEVDSDPTPPSVRRALDVVSRCGEMTREKILALDDEEQQAIWICIQEYKKALAVAIAKASDNGPEEAYYALLGVLCGWLNFMFDRECAWKLRELPDEEAEAFRSMPVNPATWKQLRTRSRWHMAYPRRIARTGPAQRMPRGALRGGPRSRSVRTGPRRARAPASQGDDDPEPSELDRPFLAGATI